MNSSTNSTLYLIPVLLLVVSVIWSRLALRRSLVSTIRGPPSPSWVVGHEKALRDQDQVGDLEFSWFRQFGSTFRMKGIFGEDVLMISDAKALQHILHTSGYRYPRSPIAMRNSTELFGHGILSVGGTTHQRHRKVLNPGFAASQLKTFSALFQRMGRRLTNRMLKATSEDNNVINVHAWLGRVTLDVIGQTAFGYKFGALEDEDNELAILLNKLFIDNINMTVLWHVSNWLWIRLPAFFHYFIELFPSKKTKRFLQFHAASKRVAKDFLAEAKTADEVDIMSGKDILSILVRANSSEDPKRQLNEEEVLSQAATLILAGHETSASTLTWMLYELSQRPEQQDRIRREIAEVRQRYSQKGEPTTNDYNSMPFLNAVIKETLRLHPIVPMIFRIVDSDDTIPLSEPIYTTSGARVDVIPVEKGQLIHVALHFYNRNPSLWGPDADEWNPDRWLKEDEKEKITVGVYANLLSFSAGVRSCIGWRFAVMEMQTIAFELLESFRFEFPEGAEIKRQPAGLMVPMARGKLREGPMMPLRIIPL